MTTERTSTRRVRPVVAAITRFRVLDSSPVGGNFVRVTLGTNDERFENEFRYLGYDQWFRLFLPQNGRSLVLPLGELEGWHSRLLDLDESVRPIVRNYTIHNASHDADGWRLEVDFVVHRAAGSGAIDGVAAAWAASARPGDEAGILDQGRIFNPDARPNGCPDDMLVVADESALPGVAGIARSLPAGSRMTALIEVAHADDIRELPTSAVLDVRWFVRAPNGPARSAALDALADIAVRPTDYVYLVGEGGFIAEARDRLRAAGASKELIDFCAYWRKQRLPVDA